MIHAEATHIIISAHDGVFPLTQRRARVWIWHRLRRMFPNAIACVLMRDHIHVVVPGPHPRLPPSLGRALGQFQRLFFCGRPIWRSIESTEATATRIVGRLLIYVWLNPCGTHGLPNPLLAEFSTYRNLFGASSDPWCSASHLARVLKLSPQRMLGGLPRRLARDLRCRATEAELRPRTDSPEVAGPTQLRRAILAAARADHGTVASTRALRIVAVQLHREVAGRIDPKVVGALGVKTSTAYRHAAAPPSPLLPAARVCLADPRLTWELAANEAPVRRVA